ncbi:uncharacterized protein LOC114532938 [Dendronephthya gigantea]|uniref:uncharacterized protein LOC114532938 n=1 Tax=Dendronephthya gigantea TaxID=151771 RepID=UPI0010694C36|nr:uncharacterized protein LOC114532938 [Dendronephthya gigantea]XP_028410326.1 uncharacterized protein LOC114532938 [Dendronephthya gigantea]
MAAADLQEKENFTRLTRLLVDKGSEALRNEFDAIHPPANLPVVLAARQKSLLRLKFRVINKSQWDLLYPPSGKHPDSKTFDVSLLTVLFRNICGLPSTGWDAMPLDSDRSTQANIIRIKTFRNEVYAHATSTRMDGATFESLWMKIAQALVELNIPQEDIDELRESPLSLEGDNSLEVLKNWKFNDQELLKTVKDLSNDVKDMAKMTKENRDAIKKICQLSMQQQSVKETFEHSTTCPQIQENTNIEINRHKDEDLLQNIAKHNFEGKIRKKVKYFLPGTREWLLKNVDDWFTGNEHDSKILLLTAGPGFGKSVFAAKICEVFREKEKLAACHFCDFSDGNLRDPMTMLQSLASQMCKNVDGFKEKLLDQLKRPNKIQTIKEAFRIYLQNPLDELELEEPSLVVIDGLDESAADNRSEIVNLIADYFSELPDCIKFLVTSRPEISIAKLGDLPKINITNSDANNNLDIQIYLESCLPILREKDEDSYRRLAKMCEGSFLYAYHVQSELQKRSDLADLTLDEIVDFLPKGLASVYHAYFRRLEDELKAMNRGNLDVITILQMLAAYKEALPLTFVAHALGLAPNCRETKTIINKVNESLSCLLYVDGDSVTIFHKSVVDWLLAQGYQDHEYTVTVNDGNKLLWLTCEQTIKKFIEKIPTSNDLIETYGESYALTYGFYHLTECDMKESFFWLVDVVMVYHFIRISPSKQIWSLFYLWNDILPVEPILSNKQLQARISWHIIELEYLQKNMEWTENSLSLSYLKSVLTHSPKGCFSDEEKRIAQSILLTSSSFLENTYDKYDVEVIPLTVWFAREMIEAVGVSGNKTMAAVAFNKKTISVVSIPRLVELWECTIEGVSSIPCCIFAPDDSFILYGKLETALDIATKKEVPFFTGISEGFVSCAFSRNGKRLITSNRSKTIKLWDIVHQRIITTLQADNPVNWCSFDITGLYIMAHKKTDVEDDFNDFGFEVDQSSNRSSFDEDSFMYDRDSGTPCFQPFELEAEKSPGEENDENEISSVGNSDEDDESFVERPEAGQNFCVWNTFTRQRCDERVLPEIKIENALHSNLCKRCFRPGFMMPPSFKRFKYSNISLSLLCDEGVSTGIYNSLQCCFALKDQSLNVIENTHGTTLAHGDIFISDSRQYADEDDSCVYDNKSREIMKIDNNLLLYSDTMKLVVLRWSEPTVHTTVCYSSFSPDSSRLATCTSDGYINIWNVDRRRVEQRFKANQGGMPLLCWWSKKFLFVFNFFNKIPSLTKYPIGKNFQISLNESQQISLVHLRQEFVYVRQVVDFTGGLLCVHCGKRKPVKMLDVNARDGPQFIALPGIEPMMNTKVSPDASFVFGGGEDVFYVWKRNTSNAVAYDVFYTHRQTNRQSFGRSLTACFSNDSKLAVIAYGCRGLDHDAVTILQLDTGNHEDIPIRYFHGEYLYCIKKSRVIVTAKTQLLKFIDMDSGALIRSSFQRYFSNNLVAHMKLSPNETILASPKSNGDMDFLRLSIPQNPLLEKIKRNPAIEWRQRVQRFRTTYEQKFGYTPQGDNSRSYYMI